MDKVKINARLIVTLVSKQDWINNIPRKLPEKKIGDQFIFIDNNDFILTCGADFSAAEKLQHYPVKVFLLLRTSNALYVQESHNHLV